MNAGPKAVLSVEIDQRIGRGVVIDADVRVAFTRSVPNGRRGARLRCDCGNVYEAPLTALTSRTLPSRSRRAAVNTQSCGCLHDENSSEQARSRNTTHGLERHPLYYPWKQMLDRCENPANRSYQHYGGRGIKVCEEWRDLRCFISWIDGNLGIRPEGMTLDRIDNDRGYQPGNVRWATRAEQNRNRPRGH